MKLIRGIARHGVTGNKSTCGSRRRQVVLDPPVLSDSLWYEGRDREAWSRDLTRAREANGYLNSCRSPALKRVIPADKLPAEGAATEL